MGRPGLREVAALAGTSTAVVSYVVNNGPRAVAPDTRRRVEEAIAELGYRPNTLARGLRAQRTATLGVVVPALTVASFAELAAALEVAAIERGYRLLIAGSGFDVVRERDQIHALLDARVDGILLVPAADPAQPVTQVRDSGVPLVVVHRYLPDGSADGVPVVVGDDRDAGRRAGQHLIEHGHRRIACLTGPVRGSPVQERAAGVRAVLSTTFADVDEDLFVSCDYRNLSQTAYESTRDLLAARPEVTAVCATTDGYALGVIRAATELGRRVGHDLAVVGIDGTTQTSYLTPALTVLRLPVTDMARCGITAVLDLIRGAPIARPPTPLPFELVPGTSCGCPTADSGRVTARRPGSSPA